MNEETYETPRFNYGVKEDDKINITQAAYDCVEKKQHHRRRRRRSKSLENFLENKIQPDLIVFKRITIYEFLFKKFKLNNNFDKEHSDIFLEEKEQAFQGYPKTDEITE